MQETVGHDPSVRIEEVRIPAVSGHIDAIGPRPVRMGMLSDRKLVNIERPMAIEHDAATV